MGYCPRGLSSTRRNWNDRRGSLAPPHRNQSPQGARLSMTSATRPVLALGLLTALNFLNYIDRYILFGVLPLIKREFHSSDTALGALTTVFFILYMCSAPAIGLLGDRKSRKLIITIGAIVWSGA